MPSLTAASGALLAPSLITCSGESAADAGSAVTVEGVAARLDDAASAGSFDGADSGVGSNISASSSTR